MVEGPPKQNDLNEKSPEQLNIRDLNFDQLKKSVEIAKTSFREIEDGFENVNGNGVYINKNRKGVYNLSGISPELTGFHRWMTLNSTSILAKGSTNKEEMMKTIRKVLEESGNRIIE